jgi:transcription elongation factor GreA
MEMGTDDIYLTQDGADRLKKELEILTGPRRREIADRLRFAVQQGDLSENADYISAKEDQAFLEGKILELEETLRRAVIIGDSPSLDAVDIGNTVIVLIADEVKRTFRVVGTKEADPRNGLISHQSPYGQALLGKRVGDVARANTPGGMVDLKVLEIS